MHDDLMGSDTPPTFAYHESEVVKPQGSPTFITAPEGQFVKLLKENIGWHEAPDPIRESNFWNYGQKIKPDARQWITSHLGLASWQNWEDDTFSIGKLLGYITIKMHQGGQRPIDIRGNLQEAVPTTFGSMYEVSPVVTTPGPAYTAAGFDLSGIDGYPY